MLTLTRVGRLVQCARITRFIFPRNSLGGRKALSAISAGGPKTQQRPPPPSEECQLTFLGTSSGGPTKSRNSTSMLLQWDGPSIIIDCGEGTLRQFLNLTAPPTRIASIFITHLHGDHIFGLASMLLHMNVAKMYTSAASGPRSAPQQPLHIYGPEGLYNFLTAVFKLSRSSLHTKIIVHELVFPEGTMSSDDKGRTMRAIKAAAVPIPQLSVGQNMRRRTITCDRGESGVWTLPPLEKAHGGKVHIKAVNILHTVPTVGFVLQEDDIPGKVDAAKATALGLPPCEEYTKLKKGLDVVLVNGAVIRSADVVGAPFKGRKLVILGDTCSPWAMKAHAMGADVLVHEATVEEDDNQARRKGHSTPAMAGAFARAVEAKRLVLTHFSARMDRGAFRPYQSWADWTCATQPLVTNLDRAGKQQPAPLDRHPTNTSLTTTAASAFGKQSVLAAQDFLTILVPRGGFAP